MHNINYYYFPENVNRNKVYAELDDVVRHEVWEEGGRLDNIRWLDNAPICTSYEEARKYIESHDRGFYDCLAVRYRDIEPNSTTKTSKALDTARKKVEESYNKYMSLSVAKHFANVKSEYVGCKECGSKIAIKYIGRNTDGNHCPVCNNDLRPQTTLDTIKKYKENWNKAQKDFNDLQAEEREKELKRQKGGKVFWLVKIEYHT